MTPNIDFSQDPLFLTFLNRLDSLKNLLVKVEDKPQAADLFLKDQLFFEITSFLNNLSKIGISLSHWISTGVKEDFSEKEVFRLRLDTEVQDLQFEFVFSILPFCDFQIFFAHCQVLSSNPELEKVECLFLQALLFTDGSENQFSREKYPSSKLDDLCDILNEKLSF